MNWLLLTLTIVVLATPALAQDYIPRLTHGPLVGVVSVAKGPDGAYHADALNVVGWELGVNLANATSETSLVAITMPQVMQFSSADDEFRYSTGLMVKFLGNFGFGGLYDLIKTPNSGLMTGQSSWAQNGTLLFSFSLPMNGGGLLNARTN
mgnify:FL=1